ncbi:hypothetical protein M430DRAFT_39234 [Amorphotheca resinae ATCC 22711]|uniref:Uncharacterized protein n=1 Tax=Amorphotheca resinae ATCC 22711 TaxID=857342 RepID=A0A2T3B9U3_AMORE|nr:hypothetical protein M430DRAFT_39234 [Amorphotheca resinae ATCC 22711]PSS25097.1 hypothetical protein M430DRAFT_39234 [Amorphotheca resinae ATCC 22711]
MYLPKIFLLLLSSHLVLALVTLDTIRDLTSLTDECRDRITDEGDVIQLPGTPQVHLGSGQEDGGEIEDNITYALRILCSELFIALETPLSPPISSASSSQAVECQMVIEEYHAFLGATVQFLHEIQERQMKWRWDAQSGVRDELSWLQSLWASRSSNTQDRSFIEQQMKMYAETGCFGTSNEVLRRDVEIVEYINDLIDLFG